MKQIDKQYLCYTCYGCQRLILEEFKRSLQVSKLYKKGEGKRRMSAEELLKYMLNFFQDIDTRLVELRNKQSKWDKKQDEILHYIENHKMDAIKSCKAVKLLQYVRDERRLVKDEIDAISSLKDTFVDKYKNKLIEKDLMLALKNLRELEERKNNPKYTYQYLTEELEIRDE